MLATNVEFWSAVVLDFAEVPAHMFTSMFTCARVAGWSAHILEQKKLDRLVRPSARYVGPGAAQARGRRGLGRDPARPSSLSTRIADARREPTAPGVARDGGRPIAEPLASKDSRG